VVAEGDVQFLLDLRVLGSMPLHETQESDPRFVPTAQRFAATAPRA
jgi:hypothetical protein